jgi:hypothetical protein
MRGSGASLRRNAASQTRRSSGTIKPDPFIPFAGLPQPDTVGEDGAPAWTGDHVRLFIETADRHRGVCDTATHGGGSVL